MHLGYVRYKGSKYLGKYRKLIQLRASQYIYNYVTIRLLTDRFSVNPFGRPVIVYRQYTGNLFSVCSSLASETERVRDILYTIDRKTIRLPECFILSFSKYNIIIQRVSFYFWTIDRSRHEIKYNRCLLKLFKFT